MENYVIREWDSEFFGIKVAQSTIEKASADEVRAMVSSCRSDRVKCLYFLADVADPETASALTTNKFKLVDVRIELSLRPLVTATRELHKVDEKSYLSVRVAAGLEDAQALALASTDAFEKSRFYVDGNFDRKKCREMYAQWILNDCEGRSGARMFIAEKKDELVGFWSCGWIGEKVGRTGLTWMAPKFRGQGLSAHIFFHVEDWLVGRGAFEALAVTQGANAASVRMHEAYGFKFNSAKVWFHRWF